MKLTFKRDQTSGKVGRVNFKLHAKIDPNSEEYDLIHKYKLADAVLIEGIQPELVRKCFILAAIVFVIANIVLRMMFWGNWTMALAAVIGLGVGYFWYHENRETIFVKDLIHGRYFKCPSVIELAKKEAWLKSTCSVLRQVMESAKNWGDSESFELEALSPEEAKYAMIKAL